MTIRQMLFGFEGRIRRRHWWLWGIAAALAYSATLWLVSLTFYKEDASLIFADIRDLPLSGLILTSALIAPLLWVQTALAAKRAHDRGHSARFVIGLTLFSAAASYLPAASAFHAVDLSDASPLAIVTVVITLLSVVANLYLLVVLGFLDGTPGPNRFGRSPKGIGGDPAEVAAEVFS